MTNVTKTKWLAATLSGLMALSISGVAMASSHREAPAISNDPAADNTDLYAWGDPTNGVLNVIANYIPLEEPSGGPNFHKFSDDVLYEIHIVGPGQADGGGYALTDAVTYQIKFHTAPFAAGQTPAATDNPTTDDGIEFFSQLTSLHNQSYTVTKIDSTGAATDLTPAAGLKVAPPNFGDKTWTVLNSLGAGPAVYNEAFADTFIGTLTDNSKAFAGPRDDGFYVDLAGIFDLANLNALNASHVATDGVAGFNTHSIALQIPYSQLPGGTAAAGHSGTAGDDSTIGVWASASRRKVRILRNDGTSSSYGPWVQVSRLGLPLINEALIGLQDKDKWNRLSPASDVADFAGYFLSPTVVRDADAVGIYTALSVPPATVTTLESGRLDIIGAVNLAPSHNIPLGATGDVLRVDLAIPPGFPNGRALTAGANTEQADVTDVLLTLILSGGSIPISDGVNHNDATFLNAFPWLALPWSGEQGHGKPAP